MQNKGQSQEGAHAIVKHVLRSSCTEFAFIIYLNLKDRPAVSDDAASLAQMVLAALPCSPARAERQAALGSLWRVFFDMFRQPPSFSSAALAKRNLGA
jgi:hypothetical protein